MLGGFVSAFRTPDLRRKLLFTIGVLALYRLGASIPTPGVDYVAVTKCISLGSTTSVMQLINAFSGGALLRLSVFALGVMPYITASIIVQLLRTLIPRFQALHDEGQDGQAKLTQYTRYITIGFAAMQAASYITLARRGLLLQNCTDPLLTSNAWYVIAVMILTMTSGTILIMWLGERITERGIGNGMSLLIFTSIASGFASAGVALRDSPGQFTGLWVVLTVLAIVVVIVFVEQAQRRIPVQYAKRMVGRKMLGGTSTYIPIKINMAGVIPVIFASSLLTLPQLVTQFAHSNAAWAVWLTRYVTPTSAPLNMLLYSLFIIFFAYFYTAITFNPEEVADNMKKYGGFIPGIRPGKPTADYLDFVLSRITAAGSLYLALVALIPTVLFVALELNQRLPFGGSSLIIVVGVGLDTVKRIQAQLEQRHYEGFLK
jgi:preprotein translocase subunit SecY